MSLRLTALGLAAVTAASAVEMGSYRGLPLGGRLADVAKMSGVNATPARTVHARPALIQELDWRPASTPGQAPDSVYSGLLRFYQGQMFQMVVTYDRDRVAGLTDADLTEAISQVYGAPASMPAGGSEIEFLSNYGHTAPVIARWTNGTHEYNLVRTGDRSSYALVLNDKRLAALAQVAVVEAQRLDAVEAPMREVARQAQRDTEDQQQRAKTRAANRPAFRP